MCKPLRYKILLFTLVLPITGWALSQHSSISLLTCAPEEVLYQRYGHTAIRVTDTEEQIDVVFNYGLFDLEVEHFYLKFLRGETMYVLGAEPYWYFESLYRSRHRDISEQVLNLTLEQKETIFNALKENLKPENREYLYNFVFDNCATRPYKLIINALNSQVVSNYNGYTGYTYRQFISHYTGKGSWPDFGINLLFGPKADRKMDSDERLFLPEELMNYMSEAHLINGSPLVLKERKCPFMITQTHWYATSYFGLTLFTLFVLIISLIDRQRQKKSVWLDITVATIYSILLIIVFILTFFSIHPLVGFGWRLLIIPALYLCARSIIYIK